MTIHLLGIPILILVFNSFILVGFILLYVLVMSRTRFRVNPHSIVA